MQWKGSKSGGQALVKITGAAEATGNGFAIGRVFRFGCQDNIRGIGHGLLPEQHGDADGFTGPESRRLQELTGLFPETYLSAEFRKAVIIQKLL